MADHQVDVPTINNSWEINQYYIILLSYFKRIFIINRSQHTWKMEFQRNEVWYDQFSISWNSEINKNQRTPVINPQNIWIIYEKHQPRWKRNFENPHNENNIHSVHLFRAQQNSISCALVNEAGTGIHRREAQTKAVKNDRSTSRSCYNASVAIRFSRPVKNSVAKQARGRRIQSKKKSNHLLAVKQTKQRRTPRQNYTTSTENSPLTLARASGPCVRWINIDRGVKRGLAADWGRHWAEKGLTCLAAGEGVHCAGSVQRRSTVAKGWRGSRISKWVGNLDEALWASCLSCPRSREVFALARHLGARWLTEMISSRRETSLECTFGQRAGKCCVRAITARRGKWLSPLVLKGSTVGATFPAEHRSAPIPFELCKNSFEHLFRVANMGLGSFGESELIWRPKMGGVASGWDYVQ